MPQEGDSVTNHFDDILRYVGEFGLWQKFLYFSSCFLVIVPSALQIASLVFATGTPKFNCVTPNVTCKESKCCEDCTSYAFDDSFTSTVTEVRHFVGRRGLVNGEALTKEPVLNIIIIWLWVALRCFQRGSVTDFNRFLNSQNKYLYQRTTKTNSPFLLTIALLEHRNC